jgi:hypothetical protein
LNSPGLPEELRGKLMFSAHGTMAPAFHGTHSVLFSGCYSYVAQADS